MYNNRESRKSVSRRPTEPHGLENDLQRLGVLLRQEVTQQWQIGDQIAYLAEHWKVKIKDLAVRFGRRHNRLSEVYRTAKLFAPAQRDPAIAFTKYELARRAYIKFGCPPLRALAIVCRENLVRNRDVTRYFAGRRRFQQEQQVLAQSLDLIHPDLINRCHHADCLTVIPRLADRSVKIAVCDLPYGRYMAFADGDYGPSVTRNECDNGTTEQVMALQAKVMELLLPKMGEGGVMLLFRPGGILDPLHTHIVTCVEEHGWDISHILTWDKQYTKLGNRTAPYTTRTERIWVLKRKNDSLLNHDNSDRSDLVSFPLVRQRTEHGEQSHLMVKSIELCEFLIKKHSFQGELILDCCGCSGNFSVAAYRLNRKFVYCEVNNENYQFGRQRIYEAMARQTASAG